MQESEEQHRALSRELRTAQDITAQELLSEGSLPGFRVETQQQLTPCENTAVIHESTRWMSALPYRKAVRPGGCEQINPQISPVYRPDLGTAEHSGLPLESADAKLPANQAFCDCEALRLVFLISFLTLPHQLCLRPAWGPLQTSEVLKGFEREFKQLWSPAPMVDLLCL